MSSILNSQKPDSIACSNLKFAYDNPKFSDKVLVIVYNSPSSTLYQLHPPNSQNNKRKSPGIELADSQQLYETIHVNSLWLAGLSEMFFNMFHLPMVESTSTYITCVFDTLSKARAFESCIRYIYTQDQQTCFPVELGLSHIFDCMLIAEQYGFVHSLHNQQSCQFLNACFHACANHFEYLRKTSRFYTEEITQLFLLPTILFDVWLECPLFSTVVDTAVSALVTLFQPHLHVLCTTPVIPTSNVHFHQLHSEVLCRFLAHSSLCTTSENCIYQLAKFWLAHQQQKSLSTKLIQRVFDCIRFPLCTKEFVLDIISNDKYFVYLYEKHRYLEENFSCELAQNHNYRVIDDPEQLVAFIRTIHPQEPEILSRIERNLYLIFSFVLPFPAPENPKHDKIPRKVSFINHIADLLREKCQECIYYHSLSSTPTPNSDDSDDDAHAEQHEQKEKFLQACGVQYERPECSEELVEQLQTVTYNLAMIVNEERVPVVTSPVFFIDGFPFILEGSFCQRDGQNWFSCFLFNSTSQSKYHKLMKVERKVSLKDNEMNAFVMVNATTSAFKIHQTHEGINAFGVTKFMSMDDPFVFKRYFQNTDANTRCVRLSCFVKIHEFCC